jgi:hypothetical protein
MMMKPGLLDCLRWGACALLALCALGPSLAPAQISFRNADSAGIAATGDIIHVNAGGVATDNTGCPRSVSPAIPAGNVGDLLIALAVVREDSATVATPAGWNLLYSATYTPAGQELRAFIFYRFATGADAITISATGTCNSLAGRVSRFRGVDQTQPFLNVPIPAGNAVMQNSNNIDTGTETTIDPNAMLLVASFINDNNFVCEAGGWNVSFESPLNLTRDLSFNLHYQLQSTAGAKSIANWPHDSTSNACPSPETDQNIGVIFALRPAGLRINVPSGTAANDVMVASIAVRPDTMVITPPSGWTLVLDTPQGAGNTSRMATYYRVATASEPASYLWTFSGGAGTGATGGIASFSGVDTAAPIDDNRGVATPSGTSHTADPVTTTVPNAMLVASFEYTSTPSDWSPPGGMNEVVDQGSITPPDDAGIKLEMAYQLQVGAGGTGFKTATSVGAAADTGVAQLLALRPLVVVVTPGSLNAFETSTAPGSINGVIRTKVAGSAFSLDVVAVQGGVQQAGFTDAVIVDLLGNNTLGVALDAQNCPTSFTLVQTVAPNPTITGGRSTVNFAAVANSWRDVRVRVRWPTASPTVTWCSTDNFAIRPNSIASFAVTDTDWQTAGTGRALNLLTFAATTPTHKAGRPFSVRAAAVNAAAATTTNYTGAPGTTLTTCVGAACTAAFGSLTLNTTFAAGQLVSDVASYDNVGSFALQLVDSAFASVDAADTAGDCTATGRHVCSATIDIGRFVPDHFAVALNTPVFGPACGPFTYIGQAFNYSSAPVITVTAQDFANNATTLYNTIGSWWRITNASLTGKSYTAAVGALDVSGLPGTDPVIVSSGLGTGTLTFGSGSGLFFTRSTPTAPASPYDADISLAINVIDADGVALATNPARFGTATTGNGIAFSDGNALTTNDRQMRFGRLVIRNANGSHLVPLRVQVEAQYWSGAPTSAFITNTQDSCTTIAAADEAMGNYTSNLSGSPVCETAIGGGGTLSAGRRTLQLAAPGSGNNGSVDLTVNLGTSAGGNSCTTQGGAPAAATTASQPHLQGNWTGGAYDVNPTARASFGIFRGAEEVVFVRENF